MPHSHFVRNHPTYDDPASADAVPDIPEAR